MSAYDWPAAAALVGYVLCYVIVSTIGMYYGYPQVLWVWAILLVTGFDPNCGRERGDE